MDKLLKHIKRETLVLAYCALSFCLVAELFASSLKSNEVSTIGKINSIIKQYSQQSNKFPKSWGEMIRDGMLAEPILGYARNYIDLESRYRFPESNRDIVIGNRKEKVIAMAIHPGLEGDNADHPDVSLRAGRWLFVVMPSGQIETRRYSELVLGQLFEAAGFTLGEYTGSGGKWLPVDHSVEQKLRIRSTEEVGLSEPNAPKIKHSGTGEEKSSATLSKERLTENWATKVVLFWIFAVLIFILGIGGYWLSKRRR